MTDEAALLTRTLRLGKSGKDVSGVKRTVYNTLDKVDGGRRLNAFNKKPTAVRRTFGPLFRGDLNKVKRIMQQSTNGQLTPGEWLLWEKKGLPDALTHALLNQYIDEIPKPKPKPVEPRQGYDSLEQSLHEAFSIGRRMGLSDLGTYNPNSKLPSGRPSDHAHYPSKAFDLGFDPSDTVSDARSDSFFHLMMHRPEVKYVIRKNQIWSVDRGLHTYTSGGHENHVHVSGF